MPQHLISFEEGVNSLVVAVPEVALSHEVDDSHMVVGKSEELVAEEYCICVVVQVEVIDGQLVQSLQALVAEHN